jgi:hypothetical protein
MRAEIKAYLKAQRISDPDHRQSGIKQLTLAMLGQEGKGELKAKGGESMSLIKFAHRLTRRFVNVLPNAELLRAHPRVIDTSVQQQSLQLYLRFTQTYKLAGGHMTPKFHAGSHQVDETSRFGNPRHRSTWEDESENGMDAKVAAKSHYMTFSLSVFQRIIAAEGPSFRSASTKETKRTVSQSRVLLGIYWGSLWASASWKPLVTLLVFIGDSLGLCLGLDSSCALLVFSWCYRAPLGIILGLSLGLLECSCDSLGALLELIGASW